MSEQLRGFQLRLTETQLNRVRAEAEQAGLTMQAYVQLRVIGEILPRGKNGARPYTRPVSNQRELPMTG